jgi:inhibitor of cysteine peptidase
MSRPFVAVLITALLSALLAAPIAAQSPAPDVPAAAAAVTIDCDEFMATPNATAAVDAPAGSAVIVSLCSNPSTGFRWDDPVSSDPTIASVAGWTYQEPADAALGAAGTEVITLVAGATGHATVTASYGQPWEGGQKDAWMVTLEVVVRDAVPVAIDCDAFESGTATTASVDAPVGSAVVLTVCSNASTGFTWTAASSSDPAVAVPGEWVSVAPAEPMPGAPGSQVLTIAADSAGSAVISASYDQPWEGGDTGAWTLELTVNVQ